MCECWEMGSVSRLSKPQKPLDASGPRFYIRSTEQFLNLSRPIPNPFNPKVSDKNFPYVQNAYWKPHETNNFVMIDQQPWAHWPGNWGPISGPQKHILTPGINECSVEGVLKTVATKGSFVKAISDKLKFIGSPKNPLLQGNDD